MVRVVAFGGSAGSFEVFREILPTLPTNAGAAYVFLSHLSRGQGSFLPKYFSRHTKMGVVCANSGEAIEGNKVYVISPCSFLFLSKKGLVPKLRAEDEPNRAVDYFFTSLAEVEQEDAIGIILSGGGTDGAKGLDAISRAGGATAIQDPGTAQFPSMPLAAIRASRTRWSLRPDEIGDWVAHSLSTRRNKAKVI
jgi:two-component system CheB/CheR fusion protein